MRRGRTLTKHLALETNQYELFGKDLGEGVPRRGLVFGMVVSVLWVLLMAPILGFPSEWTLSIYMIPPALIAYFAWQKGRQHGDRRRRATEWAVALRYALVGHRPVICLGSRSATRVEYVPWQERLPIQPLINFLNPRRSRSKWVNAAVADPREGRPADGPIHVNQEAQLLDWAQVERARERTVRRIKPQRRRAMTAEAEGVRP